MSYVLFIGLCLVVAMLSMGGLLIKVMTDYFESLECEGDVV